MHCDNVQLVAVSWWLKQHQHQQHHHNPSTPGCLKRQPLNQEIWANAHETRHSISLILKNETTTIKQTLHCSHHHHHHHWIYRLIAVWKISPSTIINCSVNNIFDVWCSSIHATLWSRPTIPCSIFLVCPSSLSYSTNCKDYTYVWVRETIKIHYMTRVVMSLVASMKLMNAGPN